MYLRKMGVFEMADSIEIFLVQPFYREIVYLNYSLVLLIFEQMMRENPPFGIGIFPIEAGFVFEYSQLYEEIPGSGDGFERTPAGKLQARAVKY